MERARGGRVIHAVRPQPRSRSSASSPCTMKIISWNIARRPECWERLLETDADVALLQETAEPPPKIAGRVTVNPAPWYTAGADTARLRPWRAAVVRLTDRVQVEWIDGKPIAEAGDGEFAVSRLGTLAAAQVTFPGRERLVCVSMYAPWERPHESADSSLDRLGRFSASCRVGSVWTGRARGRSPGSLPLETSTSSTAMVNTAARTGPGATRPSSPGCVRWGCPSSGLRLRTVDRQIGASRRRLVRQLLTEGLLLSSVGAVTGFAMAWTLLRWVAVEAPEPLIPFALGFVPDARAFLLTATVATGAGVLAALVPARQATRLNLLRDLNGAVPLARGGGRRWFLRDALVAAQLAVTAPLMVLAGVSIRGAAGSTTGTALGFDPDRVAVVSTNLGMLGYGPARADRFRRDARDRVRSMPGVVSAAIPRCSIAPGGRCRGRAHSAARRARFCRLASQYGGG